MISGDVKFFTGREMSLAQQCSERSAVVAVETVGLNLFTRQIQYFHFSLLIVQLQQPSRGCGVRAVAKHRNFPFASVSP